MFYCFSMLTSLYAIVFSLELLLKNNHNLNLSRKCWGKGGVSWPVFFFKNKKWDSEIKSKKVSVNTIILEFHPYKSFEDFFNFLNIFFWEGSYILFVHIPFPWSEISLNPEFKLPMLPQSGPKVCGVGGGCWCVSWTQRSTTWVLLITLHIHLRYISDTFQTHPRHIPDASQTHSRFIPDTFQIHPRHFSDTFHLHLQYLSDIFQTHLRHIPTTSKT